MDDTEKRLERAEKHSDGKKKHRKEREKENGIPLFYQQPKRGHGNHKPDSKRTYVNTLDKKSRKIMLLS